VKNAVDFLVATVFWLLVGYPLAFGEPGKAGAFAGTTHWFGTDVSTDTIDWAMWFFQWYFASATCTIVSGAGAERCSFQGYLTSTMCLSAFVYPVVVHWCWSSDAWLANGRTFQSGDGAADGLKFYDFAGSGVVHLTGGCVAFMLASIVGARDGRFTADGKSNVLAPHNLVLACCGSLLLILGWFGFNGGSVLGASGGSSSAAGKVCAITAIGAATGGLAAFGIVFVQSRFINLEALMNGMLSGAVSVTAGTNVMTPACAMLVGTLGGLLYNYASRGLLYLQVDDPLDASPIHGACGAWGVIAVGLFGNDASVCQGLFYGNPEQLGWQICGVLVIVGWSAGVMGMIFYTMRSFSVSMIRVPLDIELSGDVILYGGSAYPQFSTEAQPPEGEMAIVITDVQGSTSLWEWDADIVKEAVEVHEKILRDNCVRFMGFEIADEGDSLTIMFHNGFDAMKFCLVSQLDLMNAEWNEDLYEHPAAAKEEDLWAGLRVRMGVDIGHGNKFLNRVTNRLCYNGDVVDRGSALLKAVDDGGIIVTTSDCLQQLQGSFSHRLYEYGDVFMQDVGTYQLEGVTEPVPCIQVMPHSLRERPATTLSGCQMLMRPYATAPGVNSSEEDETPVSLIFCTLTNKKSGKVRRPSQITGVVQNVDKTDDEEDGQAFDAAKALEITTTRVLKHEGYITKTSNGVSLLAFPTPNAGFNFIADVVACIQEPENQGFKFCAGLHHGIPTSVAPNKASGRADYLGPPVNASARLLSLGAEDEKFHVENYAVAISSSAWMGIDNNGTCGMDLIGNFQLKGIGHEVECFKYTMPK